MIPALLLAATLTLAPPTGGPAAASGRPACIQLSAGTDTEYLRVDDHTIVVRSINRWWQLTTTPSSLLLQPQAILINDVHGPSTLCSPLDFQLSILDHPGGAREGLIVEDFVQITPEEGRALQHARRR